MPQVLVRNLESRTVQALKKRAMRNRRSLEEELRGILEEAGREATVNQAAVARRIRARLLASKRNYGDSGRDQAEDRLR